MACADELRQRINRGSEGGKGVAPAAGCVHGKGGGGGGGGGALLACSPVFCLQRCTPHHTHPTWAGAGPGEGYTGEQEDGMGPKAMMSSPCPFLLRKEGTRG